MEAQNRQSAHYTTAVGRSLIQSQTKILSALVSVNLSHHTEINTF
jgi:hypothetical protein